MISNTELEYSIISCLLIDERCQAEIDKLDVDDFTDEFAQEVFRIIKKLDIENKPIDYLSIYNQNQNIDLNSLQKLSEALPGTENFSSYVDDLKQLSNRRKLLKAADKIKDLAAKGDIKALDKAENMILSIREKSTKSNMALAKDVAMEVYEDLIKEIEEPDSLRGIDTGFRDLNTYTKGLTVGYHILAARPSMGKTTLGLNIVANIAEKGGIGVIFSLETSKAMLIRRITHSKMTALLSVYREEYKKFKKKEITKEKFQNVKDTFVKRITEATGKVFDLPIYIDDTPVTTIEHIKGECRRIRRKKGDISIIMIDYLQMMHGEGKSNLDKISNISKGIKSISKEFNCPVLVLSQLSRAPEIRQSKKPVLSDLRDSGQIEQDADTVMFIYRDIYYNKDADPYEAEIIIAKSRDSKTGIFKMDCILENYRFYNHGTIQRGK